jgi:hypothetical protein
VLPHDLDAEVALLGAALLDATAAGVVAGLDSSVFYRPAHGHIAAAITELVGACDPVDPITVADRLRAAGMLEAIGGPAALVTITGSAGYTGRASSYAEVLERHAGVRRIIAAVAAVQEAGLSGLLDPAALLEEAHRRLDVIPSSTGSTLAWADIAAVLASDVSATIEAEILTRTDGAALLYAGRVHFLWGEPTSGKGWVALTACVQVMAMGGTAVYIDLEDTDEGIVGRLLALGARPEQIIERFRLVRPTGPIGAGELADLEAVALEANPDLIVLDGLAEALANDGADENSNIEVTTWLRRVPRRLAATGAAVVVIDHVSKSKEERGRYGRGAGAKLAALDGAAYIAEVRRPFSREVPGLIDLIIAKDRHGAVGPTGATAAHFHLEPTGGGSIVRTRLEAPSADELEGKPTKAMTHISGVIGRNPGLSRSQVARSHRGGFSVVYIERAVELLLAEGFIRTERKGSGWVLFPVRDYPDDRPPDTDPTPPPTRMLRLVEPEPYEEF